MRYKHFQAAFYITLGALFAGAIARGQSDISSINGVVKDSTDSAVPGASIVVKSEATATERRSQTDSTGYFNISGIPAGFYTVRVEAAGFRTFEETRRKVDASIPTAIQVVLQVGNLQEVVTVQANAAQIQTDTATVGRIITSEQVSSLQLNGRNPIYLAQLVPGVVRNSPLSSFGFGMDNSIFIHGSRKEESMITMDGAPAVRTRAAGSPIGLADLDSTQEVQVLTANYRAEYGQSSGGQIRIVTKSGTRQLHAAFYEYFRNSALDANSWVRNASGTPALNSPAPFRFNQFGYNVNGPVVLPGLAFNRQRNKLFWLFAQEYVRYRNEQTVTLLVPSLAMRQGDFSELLSPTNRYYGRVVQVRDPLTNVAFAGNIIPPNRLSSNGIGLLRAFPIPTPNFSQGNNNWIATAAAPQNQRKDTVAVDYLPADRHNIRFRALNYNFDQLIPFRGNFDRGPREQVQPNQIVSVNYIWTVNPSTVNEFLTSASRDQVKLSLVTSSGKYERTQYGINFPSLFPIGKAVQNVIPDISIAGLSTLSTSPQGHLAGPIYMISDNISKVFQRHIVKAGFLFQRAGENDANQGVQSGQFTFSDSRTGGATTGVALANAALGLYDSYSEIGAYNYVPYRAHTFEYFVQDSWKVNSKLQVEMGLRHSFFQPWYSLWRNISMFDARFYDSTKAAVIDPKSGLILSGDKWNGLVIPGDGFPESAQGRIPVADLSSLSQLFRGVGKSYSVFHKKDLQPRLGLAYSINNRFVFRSAVGRYFTRPAVSDNVNPGANPPFQQSASLAIGSVDNPGGGTTLLNPASLQTWDPIYANPSAWMWNATGEFQISGSTIISVGYVGRRGLNELWRDRNINQLLPGTLQANPGVNVNFLRPYKGYGVIRLTANDASSRYNSFEVALNRRYSKGLLYGVSYTLAKTEDNGSTKDDILPNAYDASTFWGPADYDIRQVLAVNFAYDLPFFGGKSGLTSQVLGGWQISGITQFQSGRPFTVSTGDDFAGVGPGGGPQIWNVSGDPDLPSSQRQFADSPSAAAYWFRTTDANGQALFTAPAQGTFTTQRNRNLVYGPGFQNWNLSLAKAFQIREKSRLQFRAEAFDWINHPDWSTPGLNPRNLTTFGKVTQKVNQRNLQLSLRYSF